MLSKLAQQKIIDQLKQQTGVQLVQWHNDVLVINNAVDVVKVEQFIDDNLFCFAYQYSEAEYI
jgi:hypothetical protein